MSDVALPIGPLWAVARWVMPPIIRFGSPVQRSKKETESYWHIPITIERLVWDAIGPAALSGCRVYLDIYEGTSCNNKLRMCWGDAVFGKTTETSGLRRGEVILVPIAWRSEDRGGPAIFTDQHYLNTQDPQHPVKDDRSKYRFKLRVQAGKFQRMSPHFYLIRIPHSASNGQFILEIEYEGAGTQGAPLQSALPPSNTLKGPA